MLPMDILIAIALHLAKYNFIKKLVKTWDRLKLKTQSVNTLKSFKRTYIFTVVTLDIVIFVRKMQESFALHKIFTF